MHSSYHNTFRTIGDIPLAMVWPDRFQYLTDDYQRRRQDREVTIDAVFEEKVSIVYYYPNMMPEIIDALTDRGYKGIVIAGTGLGHVNRKINQALKRAIDRGVTVVMTVQTLWGYVQMYVYDTGRDLLDRASSPLAICCRRPPTASWGGCWPTHLSRTRSGRCSILPSITRLPNGSRSTAT